MRNDSRLFAVYQLFRLACRSIQTLFILMSDAGEPFKGFKQSSKSSTWYWKPGKYLKQDSRLQEMVVIKTQCISDTITSERLDVVHAIGAHNNDV